MSNKTEMPIERLRRLNDSFKKDTEHALADKAYDWIIDRYTKNSRVFEFSDRFVWSGAVYVLPELFGYILFFVIFYWLGNIVYNNYGWPRLFMFFMLLLLWRLNVMVKLLHKVNKKLGDKNGKKTI